MELAEVAHGQVVLGSSPPVWWCLDVQHIPVGTHDMHTHIEEGTHSEQRDSDSDTTGVVIGHPGGSMEVLADVTACYDTDGEQGWHTESAGLWRTARILFRGEVEM